MLWYGALKHGTLSSSTTRMLARACPATSNVPTTTTAKYPALLRSMSETPPLLVDLVAFSASWRRSPAALASYQARAIVRRSVPAGAGWVQPLQTGLDALHDLAGAAGPVGHQVHERVGDPVDLESPIRPLNQLLGLLIPAGEQLDGLRVARPGGELDLAPRPQRQLGESAHQPARHELAQVVRRRARGVQLVEDHVDLAECPGKAVDGGVPAPGDRVTGVVRAGVTVVAVGR